MPKTIPFLLLFCLLSAIALGQKTDEYRFSLTWSEDSEMLDIPVGKMGFEEADWSDELPKWHHNGIIERGVYDADLTNFNPIVEVVLESDLTPRQKKLASNGFQPKLIARSTGNGTVLNLSGNGIRKTENGTFERLVGAAYEFELSAKATQRMMEWADNSVLAEGEWYKIGIDRDGVYRIDRAFLQSLGIDPNTVNPQQINLYGNGGRMLPFENSADRPDDLLKNAIFVSGEADGSFDSNDYLLFYGQGADAWDYNDDLGRFEHLNHHYSDSAYYFLRIDDTDPKRIIETTPPSTADYVLSSFDDRALIENDEVSLAKTGRRFFGENFDLDPLTIPFTVPMPNLLDESAHVEIAVAARSIGANSEFGVNVGDAQFDIVVQGTGTSAIANIANISEGESDFVPNSNNALTASLTFVKGEPSAEGWLDYIRFNAKRELRMTGAQLSFRSIEALNTPGVAQYLLDGANQLFQVWDVSNPSDAFSIPFETEGNNQRTFNSNGGSLKEFIAFSDFNYLTPVPNGRVENQNLHGMGNVDMVIVCPSQMLPAAEELQVIHGAEGLEIEIVTPRQVYHEFSSGNDDVTAIRMMMKMLYDRAAGNEELQPKYLQILGDGTFDNKHIQDESGLVITYQSFNSVAPIGSYISDDYFGFLDDEAGDALGEVVQIGVGRIPAATLSEALGFVNKVKAYLASNTTSDGGAFCLGDGSNSPYGSWRNMITFISDDRDGNGGPSESVHMSNSNSLANQVYTEHNDYDVVKLYMDAYQQESTPGGERYPEGAAAIERRVQNGSLIVNYVGHGGERGFAHERILDLTTIQKWTNLNRLPLFVTATCELARYDDPEFRSAGELIIMNENGGAIAMLTTTRIVTSLQNQFLNSAFFDVALDEQGIENLTIGKIMQLTKNAVSPSSNKRNFSLLGDVALRLSYPKFEVQTTTVNGEVIDPNNPQVINSLQEVSIGGFVSDEAGNILNDFNGFIYPSVFDKRSTVLTLNNDGAANDYSYDVFKNLIYRGKASVVNGAFEFRFVVPRDIAFDFGSGRISYYAVDGDNDAHGHTEDFEIGGSAEGAELNTVGPEIKLFMNDSTFVFGGTTDESPFIFARLFDENGINTVGNGIGHDLRAVIDGNTNDPIILNDAYESDLDTYQAGEVRYQLQELAEGTHTLNLRVWDVHNNSSEANTEFVVASSSELALTHVLNYPNPFTTHTDFYFEHNQACNNLDVEVQVYTISGKLVKTIRENVLSEGFRSQGISWDGKDDFGDNIGRGVYVYRVKVVTPEGLSAEHFERLVILR